MATAHSPIGLRPEAHGIRITGPRFEGFAENDLAHEDDAGGTESWLGQGLRTALFNYCEGRGLTADLQSWFDQPIPRVRVRRDWAKRIVASRCEKDDPAAERQFVWIGGTPVVEGLKKVGTRVILPNRTTDTEVRLSQDQASWLMDLIRAATPMSDKKGNGYPSLQQVREQYPFGRMSGFDQFVSSGTWCKVRNAGLLLV